MARVCHCVNACTKCGQCCRDCTCGTVRGVYVAPGIAPSPITLPVAKRATELVDCAACNGRGLRGEAICQGCNGAGKQRV